jgi:hypothetical protein
MQHYYETIQGWMNFQELYTKMVEKFDNAKFVEIGSWKGASAAYMAVEIINQEKKIEFYCVDTWEGSKEHTDTQELYEQFLQNMEPVQAVYKAIRKPSIEAAKGFEDESLDFIFIDASHEYEDVRADIQAWLPKLRKGGIIAGHDYQCKEVRQAVHEVLGPSVRALGFCWVVGLELPKIGIGVTTHKRFDSATFAIKQIVDNSPDCKVVVVDDNFGQEQRTTPYSTAEVFYPTENIGIARAKNKCLELLEGCDFIFLFDDDVFPKQLGWWKPYVAASQKYGINHMMHICTLNYGLMKILDGQISIWKGASGQMIMVTRKVLDIVGGFPTYSKYGIEHIRYTNKIHLFGLTPYGANCSVVGTENLIHSFDNEGSYKDFHWSSKSSISEEQKQVEIAKALSPQAKAEENRKAFTPYK